MEPTAPGTPLGGQERPALIARLLLGFIGFLAIGWGAGALWTSAVGADELGTVEAVIELRSSTLTSTARVLTTAGSAYLLVPLAVICCLLLLHAGLRTEAFVVAVSLAGAMLLSDVLKLLVARRRPPVEHLQAVSGYSFPSGHATQASAFWLSLALSLRATPLAPAVAPLALVLVLVVALSRVYLGVHYPADVIAGLALGAGWATFVWRTSRGARAR